MGHPPSFFGSLGSWSQLWQKNPVEIDIRNNRVSIFKEFFGEFLSLTCLPYLLVIKDKSQQSHIENLITSHCWWMFPFHQICFCDLVLTERGSLVWINWNSGNVTLYQPQGI